MVEWLLVRVRNKNKTVLKTSVIIRFKKKSKLKYVESLILVPYGHSKIDHDAIFCF